MSVAPLKPWQRRQGSGRGSVTESIPRLLTSTSTTDCASASSSNVCPATGKVGSDCPVACSTPLTASSTPFTAAAQIGGSSSSTAPAVAAGLNSSSTTVDATSTSAALPSTTTSSIGGGYGGYGGYGSSYGGMGMYGGGMAGMYGGGMGMMNRYGTGARTGDSEFFGPTTDSLSRFNELLSINSFLLDQIYDNSVNMYERLKHILMWLYALKDAIQRYRGVDASEAERRDLRGKILNKLIAIGSIAALFLLWCFRSLQQRRRRDMLREWNRIFPRTSAL